MPFSIKGVDVWFLHCCPSLASTSPVIQILFSFSLPDSFLLPIEADLECGRPNLNFESTFVEVHGTFQVCVTVSFLGSHWHSYQHLHPKEEIRRLQQSLHFLQRQTCDRHCEIIDGESKLSCDHATINTRHIFGKYHGTKMNCQA